MKKIKISSVNDVRSVLRTGNEIYTTGRTAWGYYAKFRDRDQYTLEIPTSSGWVMDVMRRIIQENAVGGNKRSAIETEWVVSGFGRNSRGSHVVYLAMAPEDTMKFRLGSHYYKASLGKIGKSVDSDGGAVTTGLGTLSVICPNKEARDVLLRQVQSRLEKDKDRWLFTWGAQGWNARDIPSRDLETVVLRQGVSEQIVDDLDRFLDQRERYTRLGIPYHRGYLLYGPPGTGKSSMALALSSHFEMSVYSLSLHDLNKDSDLTTAVRNMEDGILLLEDVDAIGHTGVSESAFFNVLDGIGTPDGLITLMTTNHPESLNPTLLRPGRVDLKVKIDYMDAEQFRRFYQLVTGEWLHPGKVAPNLPDKEISPADIVGVLKENFDTPESIGPSLLEFVNNKEKAVAHVR